MVGEPEKLIGGEGQYYTNPVWSPDGMKIAVSGANYKGLWVMNGDGSSLANLSEEASAGFGYEWSADSKELVTTVTKFEGAYRSNAIKIFNLEQGSERELTGYRKNIPAIPHLTADNSQVYFYTGKNLEFIDTGKHPKITNVKPLYFIKHGNIYTQGSSENLVTSSQVLVDEECLNVRISPDGKKISYEVMGGNLYVMNSDGSNRVDLGEGYNARWAPDSEYLIYMVTEDDGHQFLSSELFISHSDGSAKLQLTNSEFELEMNPSWSPNGQQVVYNNDRDGAIYLITIQR
jgi:Tol biopolymer transport system component